MWMSVEEENLVGGVKEPVSNYDLLTAVMICLGKPGEENYDGILKLLDVLLSHETTKDEKSRILRDDFHIPMSQTLERKVSLMCNLSEGVWERGMEKGKENTILEIIRNLMDTMKLTAEQAMAALKVPKAEQSKYFDMLK